MPFALIGGMVNGIYESAAALTGLERWNELIAQNLASAGINGFKGQAVSFEAVARGQEGLGTASQGQGQDPLLLPSLVEKTRFTPGDVRQTSDPHDFAIQGDGFFQAQRPDGQMVYTRDGEFQVSPTGQLVTKQGYLVTGDTGPIQILPDGGPITADASGHLKQGTQTIGTLSVYKFASPEKLQAVSGGYVIPEDQAQTLLPQSNTDAKVLQGFVEGSNVSPIKEMVAMILVSNAHQANQKMISTYDQTIDRAIQALGTT